MRICFVYPGYHKHSDSNPELKDVVTRLGARTVVPAQTLGRALRGHN